MTDCEDPFDTWCYNLTNTFQDYSNYTSGAYDFSPRYHQIELVYSSLSSNKVLFLPAEQDKLHVALFLAKRYTGELKRSKKCFIYVVDSFERGHRTTNFLKKHVNLDITFLHGEEESASDENFRKYSFIVWYLYPLKEVENLVSNTLVAIFDDCVHAMTEHPMKTMLDAFLSISFEQNSRIIGLTSTLLHSGIEIRNIKKDFLYDYFVQMEKTFKSTIMTSHSCSVVKKYLANTKTKLVKYNASPEIWTASDSVAGLNSLMDFLYALLEKLKYNDEQAFIKCRLKSILDHFMKIFRNHGLYPTFITSSLSRVALEKLKLFCSDDSLYIAVSGIISDFNMVSSLLKNALETEDSVEGLIVIKNNCDAKIMKVWTMLAKMDAKKNCIILVQDALTGQMLAHVLQKLNSLEDKLLVIGFVTTDYSNLEFSTKREKFYQQKNSRNILKKFLHRSVNVLVLTWKNLINATNLNADWIFYFDLPPNSISYVTSQKYGNCVQNEHYFFVQQQTNEEMRKMIEPFAEINLVLQEILQKKNTINIDDLRRNFRRTQMSQEELDKNYPALVMNSTNVNLCSAINIVNRYCQSLPTDSFTRVAPRWMIEKNLSGVICKLQLPLEPSLRFVVETNPITSMEVTKQIAALKAVKVLQERCQLNEVMTPTVEEIYTTSLVDEVLFPHWRNEEDDYEAGTSHCCRVVPIKFPEWLYDCAPQHGVDCYVHVIQLIPNYEVPSAAKKRFFHDFLMSQQEFGIVTRKKLPEVCQFPVFTDLGQVEVSIKVNVSVMQFTDEQVEKLFSFHRFLFLDVLQVVKGFLVSDRSHKENSYYIVPLTPKNNGTLVIDWEVVDNAYLKEIVAPSDEERIHMDYINKSYVGKIVIPWYRVLPLKNYVVTNVLKDSSPSSPFSSDDHQSFTTYYSDKYGLDVKQPIQPLLEAKAITMNLNCVRPRAKTPGIRRKLGEKDKDFDETLIPEFCVLQPLPGVYWYKSITLLAIAHRLHYILVAETIRQRVVSSEESCSLKSWPSDENDVLIAEADCLSEYEESAKLVIPVSSILKDVRLCKRNRSCPWGDEQLPIDVDRNLDKICILEIMMWYDFLKKPEVTVHRYTFEENYYRQDDLEPLEYYPKFLKLKRELSPGPKQSDIYQALTLTKCGDITNMKFFKRIGCSFLKFAASLLLYRSYPNLNLSQLRKLRAKLIGKRNLFYCASKLQLGSCVKLHDVRTDTDWNFGGFCIPQQLINIINEVCIPPEVIFNLEIPHAEQASGVISAETRNLLHEKTLNYFNETTKEETYFLDSEISHPTDSNNHVLIYFKKQCTPDKAVVDVLKALTGVYLMNCGVEAGLKFLKFMDVVQKNTSVEDLLSAKTAKRNLQHLYKQIFLLGDFSSKPLLVQAFTHHSCFPENPSESNQKLSFLGDALLDILITGYVYENRTPYMTLNDLEDARLALVNDVLFSIILVRTELHKHLLVESPSLMEKIDKFVTQQQKVKHRVDNHEYLFLIEETTNLISDVDVPRALSDAFKALMAAIFIETGDLKDVWNICYILMKNEINAFMNAIPVNPVRLLEDTDLVIEYEKLKCHRFDPILGVVQMNIKIDNTSRSFIGVGEDKQHAKIIAAKLALRNLSKHFTL